MMENCTPSLLTWGDTSIEWVAQHRTEALSLYFKLMTELGSTGCVLFTVALICWLYDRRKAHYLAFAMFWSIILNLLLKTTIKECRPATENWLVQVKGYSFPSGHAQFSAAVWWGFAYYLRHAFWSTLLFIIGLSIMLSRYYLGVHYPHDVIVGALLGTLTLSVLILLEKYPLSLKSIPLSVQAIVYIILSVIFCIFVNDSENICIMITSSFFGFWLGTHWINAIPLHNKSLGKQVSLVLIGTFGIICLWKGLPLFMSHFGVQNIYTLVIEYGLLGSWIAWGAPYLNYLLFRN